MSKSLLNGVRVCCLLASALNALSYPGDASFHNAPESAKRLQNPYAGSTEAAKTGLPLYHLRCARCHGENGEGSGNIPPLKSRKMQQVSAGELFWFITQGDPKREMPSWANLPQAQRWKIVSYVQALNLSQAPLGSFDKLPSGMAKVNFPPPTPPFTDFRYEEPGRTHKITVHDLPAPYSTKAADNGPRIVVRPQTAWPKAPRGFKVELYATGLDNPRLIRRAPNGDIFLAESEPGRIRVFRGLMSDGKPEQMGVFANDLHRPYGIAFYPPGRNPEWLYVGDEDGILRFAYGSGDMKASRPPEHIADLPIGGHWTRDIQFSADGEKMFVAVGSRSNVDDPDTTAEERNRADILEFNPDGSAMRVYAYGIRNCGGGLAIHPKTAELWCSVNERDELGDNLVPDYITHVVEGGFYGWPWWYVGPHQDPRHKGKHPELKDKVIVPDVLLQAHNASLEMTFYQGQQFPRDYQGDILAAQHGSWNKTVRTGYEVIRVPVDQMGHARGEYQDFLTGFVLDNGDVWGRPVGVAVAADGSLLVTDDGSNSIWRVSYSGP